MIAEVLVIYVYVIFSYRVPVYTGYGPKYRGARVQPLTRGTEADETKTKTVALPQHACVTLS